MDAVDREEGECDASGTAFLMCSISGCCCLVADPADPSVSALSRSADCHRGLQDPPRCSAGSALPGPLHPAASAHYGLPEGTTDAHHPLLLQAALPLLFGNVTSKG